MLQKSPKVVRGCAGLGQMKTGFGLDPGLFAGPGLWR
jgi:hypothetical protein